MYAAYRKGGFKLIERDLKPAEFTAALVEASVGVHEILLFAREKPFGVALVSEFGHHKEVHAEWFDWASPREILEGTVRFFHDRREDLYLTFVTEDKKRFFNHVCRYGLLRKVGHIRGLLPDGDAILYQSAKPCH